MFNEMYQGIEFSFHKIILKTCTAKKNRLISIGKYSVDIINRFQRAN